MKWTDKIEKRGSSRPFYTFEFFPPRTDQGFANLLPRISRLNTLGPLGICITWGAGGSTQDRSLDLAGLTQSEYGIDTLLHLTCTNIVQERLDDALKEAQSRGIQNILALRGDPPRGQEAWIPMDPRFQHAIDLVTYIRQSEEYSSNFCIGVAAYPDGHPDAENDRETEFRHLKAKVDAGADFIVTQLFYDTDAFLEWVKEIRARGINVPVIPGIMPLQTYASFLRITKLCGTSVPPLILADLDKIKHDDQLVKDYGVKLATDMIRKLVENGINGVNFCTLNLEKSVQLILEDLQWTAYHDDRHWNKLINMTDHEPLSSETDLTISAHRATDTAAQNLADQPGKATGIGKGEANSASTWDEFPNGRFGDFKSPAYGVQDPWGGFASHPTNEAIAKWGRPTTLEELTALFLRHLHSEISDTPFSDGPLNEESQVILPQLEKLTEKGWWTVGSQPAVDGAKSTDPVFGWGPRGGYVYQKAFVEFFATEEDVERVISKVESQGEGWVDYFAVNLEGNLRTSMSDDGKNAVTWGVFPGQEIVQTTIIETESFLAWKDAAFSLWADWASVYAPQSPERNLLESVRKERWLVSIVHHDYIHTDSLWKFVSDL
ncbi:methylenetetrahydrofolate reductase-domain-containing protein [Thelephora terrestris]|uniref:Methylenetetrahydrofolate reductase-domain-containing protein n=1 Tax=Thelephora terrestris TaxID=56493 RepID=A0A9P6HQW0_9AGAM|nr:methylenetetrahydrofolate reductase-domain-containing protein [Thelephora terrestris]